MAEHDRNAKDAAVVDNPSEQRFELHLRRVFVDLQSWFTLH